MAPSSLIQGMLDAPRPRPLDADITCKGFWAGVDSPGKVMSCIQKVIGTIEIPVTFLHERLCQQHIVMVTLVLGNRQTNICIEFKELQGGVRATSILCLLGIGLGVGSVLLYKLCTKILSPAIAAARGKKRPPGGCTEEGCRLREVLPETPDSGISTGTTLTSAVSSHAVTPDLSGCHHDDVTFSGHGLRHRVTACQLSPLREISSPRRHPRNHDDSMFTDEWVRRSGTFSSVASDQGFVSWQRPDCEQDSVGNRSLPANFQRGSGNYHSYCENNGDLSDIYAKFTHSTPQGDGYEERPTLRRNTHSMGSDLSAYTDFSMRESLVSKGYSIDLGESLSQIGAPVFDRESLPPSSASNMDLLQREIRMIREEIGEMNDKVALLNSQDNLNKQEMFMLTPDPMKETEFSQSLRMVRQKHVPAKSESRSCSVSVDGDQDDRHGNQTAEFIWDYQSDLAVEDTANFVANRPLVMDAGTIDPEKIDYDSPAFDHVRKYIESCCDNHYDSVGSSPASVKRHRTPKQSQTMNSITDMYIDDNFSEYGDYSAVIGERNRPEGCHSIETPCVGERSPSKNNNSPVLPKQLSFSRNSDCDNNGNCETVLSEAAEKQDDTNVMNRSMCKECGSPSHRSKRQHSPVTDCSYNMEYDSVFNQSDNGGGHNQSDHSFVQQQQQRQQHCETTSQRNKRMRWEVKNVNSKVNLFEYAEREVRGDTSESRNIKKGYHQIQRLLGVSHLQPIRADNYCVLRATLYQICVNRYPVLQHIGPLQSVLRKLPVFQDPQYPFLQTWNFANRLPYSKDSVLERIQECVVCFYQHVEAIIQLPSLHEREAAFKEIVNFDPEVDLQLLEAIKVLMTVSALELYEAYASATHKRAPVFAWLMYSRESSQNPEALVRNHLNSLGDVTNAQQMELYLLGYSLGVKIEVVRPTRYGHEDFISHYPDDGADSFPKVYLSTEDNRKYHAIMA